MRSISISLLTILISSCSFISSRHEVVVELSTKYGNIEILLYDETPKHQENFLQLAQKGFYDGQLFHRVIIDFMIQGGDPNSIDADKGMMLGMGGPGYTVPAEFREGLFHKKGCIAAARQGDQVNPQKASSGSQFYIVQGRVFTEEELEAMVESGVHKPFTADEILTYTTIGGTPHLDGAYTVFGEVISGIEIVDKIASVEVDPYNRPVEDIIYHIKILKK